MNTTFDIASARDFKLKVLAFRVPSMNDLYINKLGLLTRCKRNVNLTRRSQRRIIVKENWKLEDMSAIEFPLVNIPSLNKSGNVTTKRTLTLNGKEVLS